MSARYASAVTLSTAYVTLFDSQDQGTPGADGPCFWGLRLWASAGTALIKINGNVWGSLKATENPATSPAFKFSKGISDRILKVEAKGVSSATVGFREEM